MGKLIVCIGLGAVLFSIVLFPIYLFWTFIIQYYRAKRTSEEPDVPINKEG